MEAVLTPSGCAMNATSPLLRLCGIRKATDQTKSNATPITLFIHSTGGLKKRHSRSRGHIYACDGCNAKMHGLWSASMGLSSFIIPLELLPQFFTAERVSLEAAHCSWLPATDTAATDHCACSMASSVTAIEFNQVVCP